MSTLATGATSTPSDRKTVHENASSSPPSATSSSPTPPGVTRTRVIAADVCADMRSGHLLDPSFERRVTALDSRDRRWAQEMLYGMLRRRAWIDSILTQRIRGGLARVDADLADLLRMGVYQLLYMGSVPAYAAIAQTVELTKLRHGIGASKLANAVLRRVDRERDTLVVPVPADPVEALSLTYSHPRWIVARWLARFGPEETARLLDANNTEAPVIVRPYNISRDQLAADLAASGIAVTDAPLAADSLQLGHGINLTELPAFTLGHFFVQDPAATLVTQYAAIPAGTVVADLCSAPGGKTLELARHAAQVVAADRSWTRMQRVLATLQRLQISTVWPLVTDAQQPAIAPVDTVLIDVPCTGTGTLRRHPDARWRLKISDVPVMAAIQRGILQSAAALVRPGGLLIYSTCSLEPEENELQIEGFLKEHTDFILEPPPAGTVADEVLDAGYLRVLPHIHRTDGAFAARLRRKAQ